jgi:hypothetical protein
MNISSSTPSSASSAIVSDDQSGEQLPQHGGLPEPVTEVTGCLGRRNDDDERQGQLQKWGHLGVLPQDFFQQSGVALI